MPGHRAFREIAVGVSGLMPGNPDLAKRQSVVRELRKMIRAFGGKVDHGK